MNQMNVHQRVEMENKEKILVSDKENTDKKIKKKNKKERKKKIRIEAKRN